jgi:AcrR family transcriptional regulator
MDIANNIIEKAQELFMRYGLKSISMDEISRGLGISKKTLYQFVNNKAELVEKVLAVYIEKEKEDMLQISMQSKNAIEEMVNISNYVSQLLRQVNPSIIFDLQKYYPKGWEMMQSLHSDFTLKMIENNINKGISEGLYRDDIHAGIIARFYVGKMQVVVDSRLFANTNYSFAQIHQTNITYHLYGIMSEKGIALFKTLPLFKD